VSFADWRRRRPAIWAGRLALVVAVALAAMTLDLVLKVPEKKQNFKKIL